MGEVSITLILLAILTYFAEYSLAGYDVLPDLQGIPESAFYNVTYVVHSSDDRQKMNHNIRNQSVPDEQRLMYYLLMGYEKSVRPVRNASKPVVVGMGLTMTQIFDMDEKNQVLVTNAWLDQGWHDEFLIWEPKDFNNITTLRIPCDKLWLPDIVLYNNAAEYTDGVMPANAMVKNNGDVFWPVPTKLQSSCKVDVTYFPFDDQSCRLKFGSWTYDGYQVDITNRSEEVDLSNYVVNGEWELLQVRVVRNVVIYPCCPEPFPDVTFYVHIRRRTLYYMYNVVFPCIMMSALTLLVFCLPPDSGEKIALGITVLLAFSVFMLAVAENLPETSEFVPLISIYLTIVMTLTSLSVMMTVFVLNLHHRGPNRVEVPPWIRTLCFGRMQSLLCINDDKTFSSYLTPRESKFIRTMSLKVTLDNIAQELQNEIQLENGMADTVVTEREGTTIHDHRTSDGRFNGDGRFNAGSSDSLRRHMRPPLTRGHSNNKAHDEIIQALKRILEKHEKGDRDYEIVQDWRRVAQVVDRILFWIFFLGTFISTLIILVITPASK
ncbi:neuronal acetylcholine receptor subunit alpha-10-like [Mizuhopecten yessoensis]|uniref:Neuronal acetylcholine receptor subunit alpha-10 n=1 Tax=Mizuhopecten yessoensis TaxID=6573 RepID=A0A210QVT8_MIZYE|nr:neuronal acetylcholine receptor subunit alpha-10-like [Mizuhopecten yessoensis]OWF52825.1 Neuronal acetylcholine receptor subunit alpha-10 [Mizuhopecten yessoensis]